MAVSGQNITFLALGVLGLAWLLGIPRVAAELGAIAAIAAYVLAVGWQPSGRRRARRSHSGSAYNDLTRNKALGWMYVTEEAEPGSARCESSDGQQSSASAVKSLLRAMRWSGRASSSPIVLGGFRGTYNPGSPLAVDSLSKPRQRVVREAVLRRPIEWDERDRP